MQVRWTTCKRGGLNASAVAKNNEPKAYEFVSLGVEISWNVNPGNHVPCCNVNSEFQRRVSEE